MNGETLTFLKTFSNTKLFKDLRYFSAIIYLIDFYVIKPVAIGYTVKKAPN